MPDSRSATADGADPWGDERAAAPTMAMLAHLVDDLSCSPAWIAVQLGSNQAGRRLRLQGGGLPPAQLVRGRTARAVAELAAQVEEVGEDLRDLQEDLAGGGAEGMGPLSARWATMPVAGRETPATSGPLVSAGPARAHIAVLRAAGGGTRAIAVAAGVARTSVRDVVSGRTERIREGTSSRLLAVTVDDVTGHVLVDAAPTLALIAHLVEDFGCSPAWIAAQLGSRPAGRRLRLQVGCRQLVRARTARAVAELAARVERGGVPVDGVGEASEKETPR